MSQDSTDSKKQIKNFDDAVNQLSEIRNWLSNGAPGDTSKAELPAGRTLSKDAAIGLCEILLESVDLTFEEASMESLQTKKASTYIPASYMIN